MIIDVNRLVPSLIQTKVFEWYSLTGEVVQLDEVCTIRLISLLKIFKTYYNATSFWVYKGNSTLSKEVEKWLIDELDMRIHYYESVLLNRADYVKYKEAGL